MIIATNFLQQNRLYAPQGEHIACFVSLIHQIHLTGLRSYHITDLRKGCKTFGLFHLYYKARYLLFQTIRAIL
jgi:hypothetical protein